jgi:hypothetical protein
MLSSEISNWATVSVVDPARKAVAEFSRRQVDQGQQFIDTRGDSRANRQ